MEYGVLNTRTPNPFFVVLNLPGDVRAFMSASVGTIVAESTYNVLSAPLSQPKLWTGASDEITEPGLWTWGGDLYRVYHYGSNPIIVVQEGIFVNPHAPAINSVKVRTFTTEAYTWSPWREL